MNGYILSVDQSTQSTKAFLFDECGTLVAKKSLLHKQIIDDNGWVSHDGDEIYENTILVIQGVVKDSKVNPGSIQAIGLCNQRETSIIWDRKTGKPLAPAIVWQCSRAKEICEREEIASASELIRKKTGLQLSPYFPAAKLCWLLENTEVQNKADSIQLGMGTMDSYLVNRLTKGSVYATDYSNVSRTQLFNIFDLQWDADLCHLFSINRQDLPEIRNSNACFGYTYCEGFFQNPVPIYAVLGDSHASLFGQDCTNPGLVKATYGTGSSIMMNIGTEPVLSKNGLVTSLAWKIGEKPEYVLEGNLNYTGAVITWLKDKLKLITDPKETEELASHANPDDGVYLIPAFTGLGAPYWNPDVRAEIVGMDRTTGRNEIVRAALESIAYQITDVIRTMELETGHSLKELRVDGGPTGNNYLMQFQSNIANCEISISQESEVSGTGAAFLAGIACGFWSRDIFSRMKRKSITPDMPTEIREKKFAGFKQEIERLLS